MVRRILVACAALAWSLVAAHAADRVALVIGNSAYQSTAQLPNPQNDARAMAEVLGTLGFEVILAVDADRRATIEAIDAFDRASDGAEIAIFFFAGHGIQIGGENFLLPVDVVADSERSLRYGSIQAQEVIADMERNANVSIAILDACRDNPLVEQIARTASRSTSVARGLGRMQLTGRGGLVAFAAAAGDTASDGAGNHSPYTEALLEEIAEPDVEVGLVFRRVAGRVRDITRGDQHPELLVRLVDEVYLNPTATAVPQLDPVSPAAEVPADVAVAEAAPAGSDEATGREQPAVVVASAARAGDDLYFGERVIHPPNWLEDLALPSPTGWMPGAPVAAEERDANDTFGTAQPVALATTLTARQVPRGDYDWVYVDVPTAGEVLVEADPVPEAIDLFVRAWNADHAVVADWQGAARPGGALDARLAVPSGGRYWLEMTDGSRDAESPEPYATHISFAPADDPFEPNNGMGTAWPVATDAHFSATMFPRGDVDWYKVWIPEPGLLTVEITDVPDELDMYARVWDLNASVVTNWVGPPRAGGVTWMDSALKAPGVYLVEIKDGSSDAATVEPYQVAFGFDPVGDTAEPNDTIGSAVLVSHPVSFKAATFPVGDVDWYAIDVPHPGELTFELTNSPDDLDMYFRVWTADNAVLKNWVGPGRKGGDAYDFADLPAPGRYYIEVKDGSSDAASPDLYDIDIAFTAQADQYEPNNGQADAAPLTPGRTVAFNILPVGDRDWFRVEVASAGELAILIEESPEDLDLHFRVWNDNNQVVRNWVAPYRKGGVAEGFADLPTAGAYYIEISDGSSDARAIEHATLSTVFTPVADAHEPNDSYGSPSPLAYGTPIRANILPLGDADWYRLDADRAGTFRVVIDEVDKDLDVYVRLWDGEVRASGWVGPPRAGGVTEADLAVEGAGTYRLEVKDGSSDARSPVPYRIRVDFE